MEKDSRLVKTMRLTLEACQHYGLQEYSCKHSRKDFKQSQLVACLVFKQEVGKRYRETIEFLELMPCVSKAIGLNKTPHYTTLQKALARFTAKRLEEIIEYVALLAVYGNTVNFKSVWKAQDASFDGSGYFLTNASYYYQQRIKKKVKAKHFLHSVIGVLTQFLLVFCTKQKRGPASDTTAFVPLLNRQPFPLQNALADKGFDSEENLRCAYEKNFQPLIPVREGKSTPSRTKLRKRMLKRFNTDLRIKELYGKRALNETVFSVVKRVYNSTLHGKTVSMQKKELQTRYLAYNIRRAIQLLSSILRTFLQSSSR